MELNELHWPDAVQKMDKYEKKIKSGKSAKTAVVVVVGRVEEKFVINLWYKIYKSGS